jgi:hypothetical protein
MKGDKILAQSSSNVWLIAMHAFDGMGIYRCTLEAHACIRELVNPWIEFVFWTPFLVYNGKGIIRFKVILFFILLQMGFEHGVAVEEDFQSYNTSKRS